MTQHTPALQTPLSQDQLDAFGKELDALRERVQADLGERDVAHIKKIIRLHTRLEYGGRALLMLGVFPPAWVAGTLSLGIAKILDNMEIGHNIMHGQYDWTGDPELKGQSFEWDTACPADQWRHSHNYMHHTFTNVREVDRDIGYGVLRMSEAQPWHPGYILNPLYATLLALFFEYGVALHDLETEKLRHGQWDWKEKRPMLKAIRKKIGRQALKDYGLFPLLAGPFFLPVLAGNAVANLIRNLWTFSIIFCGHFPEGTHEFEKAELEGESRGHWYYRQLLGSANISGSRWFHILSGHLSHQIEHHLFPTIPGSRYAEMSSEVKEICQRYGLPYNEGPFRKQFTSVVRKIFRLSLPNKAPRDAELIAA